MIIKRSAGLTNTALSRTRSTYPSRTSSFPVIFPCRAHLHRGPLCVGTTGRRKQLCRHNIVPGVFRQFLIETLSELLLRDRKNQVDFFEDICTINKHRLIFNAIYRYIITPNILRQYFRFPSVKTLFYFNNFLSHDL